MTAQHKNQLREHGADVIKLGRIYRCSRCDVRETTTGGLPSHWQPLDAIMATIDQSYSWAVRSDTTGTTAALCDECSRHVADLWASLEGGQP